MAPAPLQTPTLEKPRVPRGPNHPDGDGDGRRPGEGGNEAARVPLHPARIGVWLLVGAITILFAAFTSTYLARRAEADWRVGPLPPILWVNTLVLLLSSLSVQSARRSGRGGRLEGIRRGLALATVLGVVFLVGQVVAWRQVVAAGIYLTTNPHSSFFYLLTGMHGVHLLGGVGALGYALLAATRTTDPAHALEVVEPTATYWHFVDGLWLYVFAILFWF